MRVPLAMVHLMCAGRPTSRVAWLKSQSYAALALPVLPARASLLLPDDIGDDHDAAAAAAALTAAYAAFAKASRLADDGDAGRGGRVVELELPAALALIRAHGRPLLDAVRRTGFFLYRGETLRGGDGGGKPRAVVEVPDLLDEDTYGSPLAAEYFRAADAVMAEDFRAPARPSNAHIMVSNKDAAAAWGTACSVWPLGSSLNYAWLDNCSELWDPSWEKPGRRSPTANGNRESFFWRDKEDLRRFFAAGLRVNSGLPEAMRRRHEILVRSGGFSLGTQAELGGGLVVEDSFVCIPASEDGAVRSALGVPPEGVRF